MAKTKERSLPERMDALRADHLEAQDRLAALESELAGIDAEIEALPWDADNVEASMQAAIVLDSRRRIALPRAIRAAKLAELEAREAVLEAREAELEARRGPALAALEEAEKALAEARENHRKAKGVHGHLVYNEMSDLRNERRAMLRERNSVESEDVQPRGLPVYSVWQQNARFTPEGSEEPALSGDSPATGWGVANVNDKPLSEGSGEATTVGVVPTKALKRHAKRKK